MLQALSEVFEDPSVLKIFHDAKYNIEVLVRAGVTSITPIDDTMLMSYAQDAGNFAHDAATLAAKHLGHTVKTFDSVAGSGRNRLAFASVPLAGATSYAAEAADVTLRLWLMLKPLLRTHQSLALYELVEKKLIPVLTAMELCGVMVDRENLSAMSVEFEGRMAEIEAEI